MKNPSGNKLEKLVFGIFDQMVEGADKYVTKQGSTWLIFTESKKWVIEFTEDKTLWFNYNIFQNELDLIGKDCTEERDLIKNWFESRFLNKPKVEETKKRRLCPSPLVEDTIQNGVIETHHVDVMKFFDKKMENTIENGVKHTRHWTRNHLDSLEDTIQNGVKYTRPHYASHGLSIEDTIQEGVKETIDLEMDDEGVVEYFIKNGVKETRTFNSPPIKSIEDTIQNGVKETQTRMWPPVGAVDETIENGVKYTVLADTDRLVGIEDTIENGVKETKENRLIRTISVISTINNGVKEIIPLPVQDGNRDWGLYYQRQKNLTKPHTEYVKEVIEDPYNHRGRIDGVIRNMNKDGI
jgi:hypothetical protein